MPKKILIIIAIIVAVIAIGATATYIIQRQEGKEVEIEQGVATHQKAFHFIEYAKGVKIYV